MLRTAKVRVGRWCPCGPNRTPDSLPSSQGPDHTAWMWPMVVALKHPFKVRVFRLRAMDRQNQGTCLIFRNIFKKRGWFTRVEELVFGALLARSLSSQGKFSVAQGVQGLLRRDCRISEGQHRLEGQCHLPGSSAISDCSQGGSFDCKGCLGVTNTLQEK